MVLDKLTDLSIGKYDIMMNCDMLPIYLIFRAHVTVTTHTSVTNRTCIAMNTDKNDFTGVIPSSIDRL